MKHVSLLFRAHSIPSAATRSCKMSRESAVPMIHTVLYRHTLMVTPRLDRSHLMSERVRPYYWNLIDALQQILAH